MNKVDAGKTIRALCDEHGMAWVLEQLAYVCYDAAETARECGADTADAWDGHNETLASVRDAVQSTEEQE